MKVGDEKYGNTHIFFPLNSAAFWCQFQMVNLVIFCGFCTVSAFILGTVPKAVKKLALFLSEKLSNRA